MTFKGGGERDNVVVIDFSDGNGGGKRDGAVEAG
jgi:hypothetical protein